MEQWITGGQELEAQPGREILLSVFQKESPLHDGAAVIRKGRMVLVACYLPLSSEEDLPNAWGTRHRAAMGLSEKCDAMVIVVSEEKGEVTLMFQKKATSVVSADHLSSLVQQTLQPVAPPRPGWKKRTLLLLLHRWKAKAGSLALVLALWLLLAGQQNFEVTLTLSLETRNMPADVEIVEPLDPQVRIRVRGLRKDAGALSEKNVRVELDLSGADAGRRTFLITREEILLPNERVSIVRIEPSQMTFRFQQKTNL